MHTVTKYVTSKNHVTAGRNWKIKFGENINPLAFYFFFKHTWIEE